MYFFEVKQSFEYPASDLWDFISSPKNLNKLTPKELHFEIVSNLPEKMYDGLMVEYKIKVPFLGKVRWLTEIKHIENSIRFVDEQRIGPYKLWYHEHYLTETGKNTCTMTDKIHYDLFFPFIKGSINKIFVKPKLEKIFSYRKDRLNEIFG